MTTCISWLWIFLLYNYPPPTACIGYDEGGWRAAANFLTEAMDTSVNPCKNFYQFACGNWQKTYGEKFIGEPQKTIKHVADALIKAIGRIRLDDPATPTYQKRLKIFFEQCKLAPIEYDVILTNVYNMTSKLFGPMPLLDPDGVRPKNIYYLLGYIQRYTGAKVFIDTAVMSSQEKCETTPQLTIGPAFGYKELLRLIFLKYNDEFAQNLTALAIASGNKNDTENIRNRINELAEFEKNITDYVENLDMTEPDVYRLSELRHKVNRNVDWTAFFTGLMPAKIRKEWSKQNPKITIYGVEYFRKLHDIVNGSDFQKFLDYAYLKLFDKIMTDYVMTPSLLLENTSYLSPEYQCVEFVLKLAGAAAARVFFESVGHRPNPKTIWNWKHDLEMLAEAVFAAFRYMIHTAEWLDVDDKAAIVDKVNSIRFASGIPQWILNDTAVLLHTPPYNSYSPFFKNMFNSYRQKLEWSLEPLMTGKILPLSIKYDGVTPMMDPDPNFNWNAIYFQQTVELWMGLTLPPMYNYSYPLALKFGVLGWIIGHELFHGFDRKRISGREDMKRWLKPSTIKEFTKRVQCIVKQYSGFCYPEHNFCVSGDDTVNDNIADMDGIKVAYMAYKFVMQSVGHQRPLPGLERFTPDQLFFLSAARVWCGAGDASIYKGNDHAPGRARIELSMMNFPAFAQAFRCPTGSKFAPLHTCTLWGDFLEPTMDGEEETARRR